MGYAGRADLGEFSAGRRFHCGEHKTFSSRKTMTATPVGSLSDSLNMVFTGIAPFPGDLDNVSLVSGCEPFCGVEWPSYGYHRAGCVRTSGADEPASDRLRCTRTRGGSWAARFVCDSYVPRQFADALARHCQKRPAIPLAQIAPLQSTRSALFVEQFATGILRSIPASRIYAL